MPELISLFRLGRVHRGPTRPISQWAFCTWNLRLVKRGAPDLEPLAVLKTVGIRTEILTSYEEQKNIDGSIEVPIVLAKSGKAPGRWCDVVVPFSTEQFWIRAVKRLNGVTDVQRKPGLCGSRKRSRAATEHRLGAHSGGAGPKP